MSLGLKSEKSPTSINHVSIPTSSITQPRLCSSKDLNIYGQKVRVSLYLGKNQLLMSSATNRRNLLPADLVFMTSASRCKTGYYVFRQEDDLLSKKLMLVIRESERQEYFKNVPNDKIS